MHDAETKAVLLLQVTASGVTGEGMLSAATPVCTSSLFVVDTVLLPSRTLATVPASTPGRRFAQVSGALEGQFVQYCCCSGVKPVSPGRSCSRCSCAGCAITAAAALLQHQLDHQMPSLLNAASST